MPENKIVNLETMFSYVKRAKFMSDYANIAPSDAGVNYRCLIAEPEAEDKGIVLTCKDYALIAAGVEAMIDELKSLHTDLLLKSV